MVEAMDEISTTITKEWIGLIILPSISSVAGEFLRLTVALQR
jgi:Ca2+:H+ antiporter